METLNYTKTGTRCLRTFLRLNLAPEGNKINKMPVRRQATTRTKSETSLNIYFFIYRYYAELRLRWYKYVPASPSRTDSVLSYDWECLAYRKSKLHQLIKKMSVFANGHKNATHFPYALILRQRRKFTEKIFGNPDSTLRKRGRLRSTFIFYL